MPQLVVCFCRCELYSNTGLLLIIIEYRLKHDLIFIKGSTTTLIAVTVRDCFDSAYIIIPLLLVYILPQP